MIISHLAHFLLHLLLLLSPFLPIGYIFPDGFKSRTIFRSGGEGTCPVRYGQVLMFCSSADKGVAHAASITANGLST